MEDHFAVWTLPSQDILKEGQFFGAQYIGSYVTGIVICIVIEHRQLDRDRQLPRFHRSGTVTSTKAKFGIML
jgi:hypothetical protein